MIQLMMNLGIVPWTLNNELTAYWTMWGTIATALATGGLVWMAWRAWKAALNTLKGQQTHVEISALRDYMNALHALANLSATTPASHMPTQYMNDTGLRIAQMKAAYEPYVEAMANDVKVAGSIWRAYHADEAAGEFGVAEDILVQAQGWRINPRSGTERRADEQYAKNSEFAVRIASHALRWQARPKLRTEENRAMVDSIGDHWNTSPCRPDEAIPANSLRRAD